MGQVFCSAVVKLFQFPLEIVPPSRGGTPGHTWSCVFGGNHATFSKRCLSV